MSRADVPLGRVVPERLIASEGTMALRKKLGLPAVEALTPRFGRPFSIGRARLELIPAGVLPGSAQLLIELGSWRGLYAGLVSPRAVADAEPLQTRGCDELVVDAPEDAGVVDEMAALDGPLAPADLRAAWALRGHEALSLSPPLARALGRKRNKLGDARRVVSGTRAPSDAALALGLGPTVDELLSLVADCGAKRVHVRVPDESPRRIVPARALVTALRRRRIVADVMAPPAQLTLFAG